LNQDLLDERMSRILKVVASAGSEGFTRSETLTNQNENNNPENPGNPDSDNWLKRQQEIRLRC
jgi:hypothetical protein